MTFAALEGLRVTRARVQIPAWGCWFADVDLDAEADLSGAVTLEFGGVSFAGTIQSGGSVDGRSAWRLIAGAGGWGTTIASRGYSDDGGVKVRLLLTDAAQAAGEVLGDLPATRVGTHYTRAEAPARRVLEELAPRGWYVDTDGVTQIGTRPEVVYLDEEPTTRIDDAVGVVELAPETAAGLLPGLVIGDRAPATDVELTLDAGKFRASIYAGVATTRRLEAFRQIFDALDPRRIYRGCFDFRVVTLDGDRVNLQPVRAVNGLPDLSRVPVRPGMAGLKAVYTLGSVVLVTFVDADPSRPVVIAHEGVGGPGWMPTAVQLGTDVAKGAARLGDTVVCGPWSGVITSASTTVLVGD